MVLNDDLMPGDPAESPPGFLYDNEFSDEPARAMGLALRSIRIGTTEIQREGDSVIIATPLFSDGDTRPPCSSPTASSRRRRRSSSRCARAS